ncbi:MAG TPA: phosphatase PAP2 family protein [Mucilaginibacter sp.]|nr:phosphatase PAP2 family protein [Mucilaginibacter sp.]
MTYCRSMLEHLVQFDRHLFHIINHDMANGFFDWLMPLLRNARFWIPLYIFILVFCIWRYKKRGILVVVMFALSAGVADFTSASLIKYSVKRLRPCHDLFVQKAGLILRVPCGPGYSFPSTHATDHFAMAAFLCLVFGKKWKWIWLWAPLWAASISFAQIYVGVHFPIDVVCGTLYGIMVGALMAFLFKKLQPGF